MKLANLFFFFLFDSNWNLSRSYIPAGCRPATNCASFSAIFHVFPSKNQLTLRNSIYYDEKKIIRKQFRVAQSTNLKKKTRCMFLTRLLLSSLCL